MKAQRHAAILRLVREHSIPSQERLRALLAHTGVDVTQATLSRDIHELGLVKQQDASGTLYYAAPDELVPTPTLAGFLPSLLLRIGRRRRPLGDPDADRRGQRARRRLRPRVVARGARHARRRRHRADRGTEPRRPAEAGAPPRRVRRAEALNPTPRDCMFMRSSA